MRSVDDSSLPSGFNDKYEVSLETIPNVHTSIDYKFHFNRVSCENYNGRILNTSRLFTYQR